MKSLNVCVVLVEPENPDNIGAVARALKNLEMTDLRLVSPPRNWKRRGKKMAMSGYGVLRNAKVFRSLNRAVSDLALTVGTSRRKGRKRGQALTFDRAIEMIQKTSKRKTVGIIFGKESKGLSNEHLTACDWVTSIPANPQYPSFNLSQAVLLMAFSVTKRKTNQKEIYRENLVSKAQVEDVIGWFSKAVTALNYKPGIAIRVERTFRALLKRSGLMESEAQMIRGLSRRIWERAGKKDSGPRSKY